MKYLKNYNTFILEKLDVDISKKLLRTLVGKHFSENIVDFSCRDNKLNNLIGSPKEVSGNFSCSNNKLTSLEGAPIYVGNGFYCQENKLTSLEHAPKIVNFYFNCSHNKLKNLDYLSEIGERLICHDNDWTKPIPYKIMAKYNLHCLINENIDRFFVYTQEQYGKFSSFEYQKEFLEREPENYLDLKPLGYAKGIEELFPHLFDMDELGLID